MFFLAILERKKEKNANVNNSRRLEVDQNEDNCERSAIYDFLSSCMENFEKEMSTFTNETFLNSSILTLLVIRIHIFKLNVSIESVTIHYQNSFL